MGRIDQRPLLLGQQLLRGQQQNKKEETRQLLVEIYIWFTEELDTKDLPQIWRTGKRGTIPCAVSIGHSSIVSCQILV